MLISGIEASKKRFLIRMNKGAHVLPKDIFIVSTIGQIANARRVIADLKIKDPFFVYLFTAQNMTLADRLEAKIVETTLQFEKVELPKVPSRRLPWQIYTITKIYNALAKKHEGANLWISNINSHYGYLAHIFTQHGSSVNYFEEGLSTYLQAHDPRLKPKPRRTINDTFQFIKHALLRSRTPYARRFLNCIKLIVLYIVSTRTFYSLSSSVTGGTIRNFHENWTTFDRLVATHPELMDPELYQARTKIKLSADMRVQSIALNTLTPESQASILELHSAVLINQHYGVDPDQWAEFLAESLLTRGYSNIFVKFHPREQPKNRANLIVAMQRHGLTISESPEIDQFPIESIIQLFRVKDVIGLTSTSLLQISAADHNLRIHSIGFLLLNILKEKKIMSADALELFQLDNELLERMSEASNARIEFWR